MLWLATCKENYRHRSHTLYQGAKLFTTTWKNRSMQVSLPCGWCSFVCDFILRERCYICHAISIKTKIKYLEDDNQKMSYKRKVGKKISFSLQESWMTWFFYFYKSEWKVVANRENNRMTEKGHMPRSVQGCLKLKLYLKSLSSFVRSGIHYKIKPFLVESSLISLTKRSSFCWSNSLYSFTVLAQHCYITACTIPYCNIFFHHILYLLLLL